jgi:hypothetical protein
MNPHTSIDVGKCLHRILYLTKSSFKIKSKIGTTFCSKRLEKFTINKPYLNKFVQDRFQYEKNSGGNED